MPKFLEKRERRKHFGLLKEWYGEERASMEIIAHSGKPIPFDEVLENVCRQFRSPEVTAFITLDSNWEKIAGAAFARFTRPSGIRDGILYLEVRHSGLIRELTPSLDLLLTQVAAAIGDNLCQEIRLIPSGTRKR